MFKLASWSLLTILSFPSNNGNPATSGSTNSLLFADAFSIGAACKTSTSTQRLLMVSSSAVSDSLSEYKRDPSADCGHVFILNCGVNGIAADGILLRNNIHQSDIIDNDTTEVRVKEDGESSKVRFYETEYSTNSQNYDSHTNRFSLVIKSFLDQAATYFKGKGSAFRRAKPLLAFNPGLLHTNDDRFNEKEIEDILPASYDIADKFGVDIAICIPNKDSYKSVQCKRTDLCPFYQGPFWMLSNEQKDNASNLSVTAKSGRLSVFIGAGISIPSGAPSWGELLDLLAIKANMNEEDRSSLKKLDFLDQPTILAEDLGDKFKQSIGEIVEEYSRYTPCHALLRSMKSPAVTTNYDSLYEMSALSCDEDEVDSGNIIHTLPWDSREMISRNHVERSSLLKMHGCVKYPESIVLSRCDYMRYQDSSQALIGRLLGMFLTSEILFCGASMTDDNVHKAIDSIRKVLYSESGNPMEEHKLGTILMMTENKMFNRLWDQDFKLHSFGKSWSDDPNWYHDCFIDCIVASIDE